jgi:hypothetical protein
MPEVVRPHGCGRAAPLPIASTVGLMGVKLPTAETQYERWGTLQQPRCKVARPPQKNVFFNTKCSHHALEGVEGAKNTSAWEVYIPDI